MTTFTIARIYEDELSSEADGDDRLRGFSWLWSLAVDLPLPSSDCTTRFQTFAP